MSKADADKRLSPSVSTQPDSQALQRIAGIAQVSTASEAALLIVFDKFSVGAGLHDELQPNEIKLILTLCAKPVSSSELMRHPNVRHSVGGGDIGWAREHPHLGSVVGAPIWVSGVRIGTLVVTSTDPHTLDDFEANVLAELAELASASMQSRFVAGAFHWNLI